MADVKGKGTKEEPWTLKTPPGKSEYQVYRDETVDPPALVCVVGKTTLSYQLRCIEDLHVMLKEHGDWMLLGSADEQKPAKEGTVEEWARSADNPIGGWYGLRKGFRGTVGVVSIKKIQESETNGQLAHDGLIAAFPSKCPEVNQAICFQNKR